MKASEYRDYFRCPTHRAVREFSRVAFAALARKVIRRLQLIPASGIFDADRPHKSLWDEYCHEVQNGPHDMVDRPWDFELPYILEHFPIILGRIQS
jgi:hypothetical protein